MAKGFKFSKKMLMIGGVVLTVAVVVVMMFRSSEEFQVISSSENYPKRTDDITNPAIAGSGPPPLPPVTVPEEPKSPGVINPNTGSGYAGSSAPPSNLTPDGVTQFNSVMQRIKGRGTDMSYIENIFTISNNAGMAAKMVDNNVYKKLSGVTSEINVEKSQQNRVIFFKRQIAIAKNNKNRLPLSQLLSDYLDVQIPKLLYFEIHMSSLYALMISSALLVERCSDKNNWLFKSAETSALQRIANNELNNYITLMKTFFNPKNLPNIIKDVLTSEANIIAAGGRIPYGGLSSTLSPIQTGNR